MKTRIHVNQHAIRKNRKEGTNDPVITVKTYKDNIYCHEVAFKSGRVVYSPDKPLSCGAVLYVETDEEVEIIR